MDPIREHMTRAALAMFPEPLQLSRGRIVPGQRPMLLMPRERPLARSEMLGLGRWYRVDLLTFVERGKTWN